MTAPVLVLASGSQARARLLQEAGYTIQTAPSGAEEPPRNHSELLPDYVTRLARLKLEAVRARLPNAYILAADTDIELDGTIVGKPANETEAEAMIARMQGRTHHLSTGHAICAPDGQTVSAADNADIEFHPVSPDAIRNYVHRTRPFHLAGAYAIQAEGKELIRNMQGREDTIIGLCLPLVKKLLDRVGYDSS